MAGLVMVVTTIVFAYAQLRRGTCVYRMHAMIVLGKQCARIENNGDSHTYTHTHTHTHTYAHKPPIQRERLLSH